MEWKPSMPWSHIFKVGYKNVIKRSLLGYSTVYTRPLLHIMGWPWVRYNHIHKILSIHQQIFVKWSYYFSAFTVCMVCSYLLEFSEPLSFDSACISRVYLFQAVTHHCDPIQIQKRFPLYYLSVNVQISDWVVSEDIQGLYDIQKLFQNLAFNLMSGTIWEMSPVKFVICWF